ncbi:MAG: 4-hydroxy-3-methylbut-2-enyl diphosphate reductase [candidate division Zixibacteria bacterium]|nr:4-hydroxy-3-methylbut-2-enyl diphosphate reductase [candidate division Zixibacteria bacterium]
MNKGNRLKKIILADYYGFCMGVKRAISLTEETVARYGKVTILKEIVHNEAIVEKFKQAGIGQSIHIADIDGGTVVIPAHGASPEVFKEAEIRGLAVVDATCPLVIRIHKIVKRLAENGYHILHFGDNAHDETLGIVGHAPDRVTVVPNIEALRALGPIEGKLALTSQTTARVSGFVEIEREAKKKYPQIELFNTICNATNQRQVAIMDLAPWVDLMLVVGSESSANSKRLAQISKAICGRAYLIDNARDIKSEWFSAHGANIEVVGLSAGASTPDFLIDGAIERLKEIAGCAIEVVYPPRKSVRNELAIDDDD